MSDFDELLDLLSDQNTRRQPQRSRHIFTAIVRRLWKGGLGAVALLLLCLLMSKVVHYPLSKISMTSTKMDVMLQREREANRNNNVSYEIVGEITGWHTTTNKYDEMAIMLSQPVVERTLHKLHLLDSVFVKRTKQLGHQLSPHDSVELMLHIVEEYANKVEVTYGDPLKGPKNSFVTLMMDGDGVLARKILSGLVDSYNAYTREYNDMCYQRTIRFLSQSIDSIRREIDKIDLMDESFSESNFIVDMGRQAESYLEMDREDEKDVRDMQLQRELLSIIRQYMADMGQNYVVVPANTGIEDTQINRIVIEFNDLVMRRSNFLTSMGEDAMRVQTITNQIEDQRQAIIISIDKLTQAFDIRLKKYETNKRESENRLLSMPHKNIVKDKISRERNIILPLYTHLQQKLVETIIARSAEQDQARVITPPYSAERVLLTSPKFIYLCGIFLGILLALVYLWNLKIPEEKVSLEDVLKDCVLPVWGVLPNEGKERLYHTALEALLTRIRMSGSKRIVLTCGYDEDYTPSLIGNIQSLLKEQDATGIEITEMGNYHNNPKMPELSLQADATLYCVQAGNSQMRSIDFIAYAVKEGLLKNGAVIVTNALTNEHLPINFGAFDYEVPKGLKAVKSRAKK